MTLLPALVGVSEAAAPPGTGARRQVGAHRFLREPRREWNARRKAVAAQAASDDAELIVPHVSCSAEPVEGERRLRCHPPMCFMVVAASYPPHVLAQEF
jgi:hypothetical protein